MVRATAVLRAIIVGQEVRCVEKGRDRYRRVLAICYVGEIDIGGELVRRGWALAYRQYGLTYVRHSARPASDSIAFCMPTQDSIFRKLSR